MSKRKYKKTIYPYWVEIPLSYDNFGNVVEWTIEKVRDYKDKVSTNKEIIKCNQIEKFRRENPNNENFWDEFCYRDDYPDTKKGYYWDKSSLFPSKR